MIRYHLLTVTALLCVAGCGRGSIIGARVDDFSAYYNTYFNAEQALDTGVKAFEEQTRRQPVNQDVYLSLFGRSERATTQRKPFEDAIQKSADILREHPDSKWVDDAMMVIGKAWFHTLNFVGADGKFREILALESPLHDEARFWLARTYIASGAFDAAYDHLQATLSREGISRRWEPKLRMALAELHVKRENWEEAVLELESGLAAARDRELASRAQFLLGQVYEGLARYPEAIAAYEGVQEYQPVYELSYAAQYSAVRVQGDHGDPATAMGALRRMERDDKNYEHRAELAYLRGRIFQELGYYDETMAVFDELLYDPTAQGAPVRGATHYSLGVFYRDVMVDYPYAAAHFDTAKSSLKAGRNSSLMGTSGSAAPPLYAPGAITDGEELARIFVGYTVVLDRVVLMDSLLFLGSLDDSTFQAVVLELRERLAEERKERQRLMERQQIKSQFRGRDANNFDGDFGRTPAGKDIGRGATGDAGFLFHREPARMQQSRADFFLLWGDRPLAPNWRRIDAVTAVARETEGLTDEAELKAFVQEGEALPEVDVSSVPRDSLSQKRMRSERALARYELGNVLFLSMEMPDSAAAWYRMVIEDDADEPVAQRAFYALAEMQRALGDTLAAHGLYREILERDPRSEFAAQAAARLGLGALQSVAPDSLTRAENAYGRAHVAWQRGAYTAALDSLAALATRFPTTSVAPRALLAAAQVYLEWAVRDSLDLFGVLPLSADTSMLHTARWWPEGADSDSTSVDSLNVVYVYQRLADLYPFAPEAKQARKMQIALDEHWQILHPPDTSSVLSDTLNVPPEAMAGARDSLAMDLESDTLVVASGDSAPMSEEVTPVSAGDGAGAAGFDVPLPGMEPSKQDLLASEASEGLREAGLGLVDWSQGGYTVLVGTERSREAAVGFARNFGRAFGDFPHAIDIFTALEEEEVVFRIGIGLFKTLQEAEAIMEDLADYLPPDSRVMRLPKRI